MTTTTSTGRTIEPGLLVVPGTYKPSFELQRALRMMGFDGKGIGPGTFLSLRPGSRNLCAATSDGCLDDLGVAEDKPRPDGKTKMCALEMAVPPTGVVDIDRFGRLASVLETEVRRFHGMANDEQKGWAETGEAVHPRAERFDMSDGSWIDRRLDGSLTVFGTIEALRLCLRDRANDLCMKAPQEAELHAVARLVTMKGPAVAWRDTDWERVHDAVAEAIRAAPTVLSRPPDEAPDDLINHARAAEIACCDSGTIRRWLDGNKLNGYGAGRKVSEGELRSRLPHIQERRARTKSGKPA